MPILTILLGLLAKLAEPLLRLGELWAAQRRGAATARAEGRLARAEAELQATRDWDEARRLVVRRGAAVARDELLADLRQRHGPADGTG